MIVTAGKIHITFTAPKHHRRLPMKLVAAGLGREEEDEIVAAWYLRERGDAAWREGRTPADMEEIERARSG